MQPSLQAKGPVSFQAADLAYKLCPKNAKVGQTDYRSLLSVTEFNLLVRKMVATFEGDVQSLGEDMPRAALLAMQHIVSAILQHSKLRGCPGSSPLWRRWLCTAR